MAYFNVLDLPHHQIDLIHSMHSFHLLVNIFTQILIANRSEIACRVMRTAHKMGIQSVAVYSDADRSSLFVQEADEAYHIGGAASLDSYLKMDKVIQVAKRSGAQAIHPGYGFLSESMEFAELCQKEGLIFIGPPSSAIRDMGIKRWVGGLVLKRGMHRIQVFQIRPGPDLAGFKIQKPAGAGFNTSKHIMSSAGVPIIEGYHGDDQSEERLLKEAERIGFPVMIKAVRGGGGKGMRIALNGQEFLPQLESARNEAYKAYKDTVVLIEKYVQCPRHVEVQIFGDMHDNYVYLFERDCSVQRRHQKVIEEAPAPHISEATRKRLGEAACRAARAVKYVGAGTVEFIMDREENFYFMEMNTRLQVEHPVTEMVTGTDLVQWQIMSSSSSSSPPSSSSSSSPDEFSPFVMIQGVRMNHENTRRIVLNDGVKDIQMSVTFKGDDNYEVKFNDLTYKARASLDESRPNKIVLEFSLDGYVSRSNAVMNKDVLHFFSNSGSHQMKLVAPLFVAASNATSSEATGHSGARSPMPGVVDKIFVRGGQRVEEGQPVAVIIAMKMEYVIRAPKTGVVEEVIFQVGDTVKKNAELVHIKEE
ncbi:hypothetical protein HELRODRAFT_194608 [Helobdella robusta]|uniref:Methylcrotonoyl-CoA carboxylase subunit alpha, mitochondrial n=1 Tax=Helobdella robusta TaxID=6412 RepID=T1FW87_HELRO|nr:hypothetical protein HELRODRAFT_194608 [Helobdella robusta]ESN90986.1 hypothetical protein HELRODRAFT_194608 [Helobdella robusta]